MKDITIYPQATIKEAMEALDKTAEKVLLVVDDQQVLLGTLTDGDIRRHILKSGNLSGTIRKVYKTNPRFILQEDFNLEQVRQILTRNKIELLPVLDRSGRVMDFTTWSVAFGDAYVAEKKKLDAPVVIMAGGKGTRLEPFTKVLPKPLIPVGDKPVIDHIIDRFRVCGINEFYLTTHHMSKIIRAYFEEKNPEYSLKIVEENAPRGTAGSLTLLADILDRPFFVSNCDVIIEIDYPDLYRFHKENGYAITLVASAKRFNIPYGVCELNNGGSLKYLQEKPEYNFLVNTGLYVLNPNVIDLIPKDTLFHITHLMDAVREREGIVGVYPISEKAWIDVGQWAEYRKALKVIEGI